MSFMLQGKKVTLVGEEDLHQVDKSFGAVSAGLQPEKQRELEYWVASQLNEIERPHLLLRSVEEVLQEFQCVLKCQKGYHRSRADIIPLY